MQSTQDILNEREQQYGSYASFCEINGALRKVSDKHVEKLTWQQQTAVEMMLFKIARILNNGANHQDNWQDIAGYAMLGGKLFEPQLSSNTLQLPKPLTEPLNNDDIYFTLTAVGGRYVIDRWKWNNKTTDHIFLKNDRIYKIKEEVTKVIEVITGKPYEDR